MQNVYKPENGLSAIRIKKKKKKEKIIIKNRLSLSHTTIYPLCYFSLTL